MYKKLKNNSNGFSAVESLILLLVLLAIGFIGYKLLNKKQAGNISSGVKTSSLVQAQNIFGLNLLKDLSSSSDKNVFISPTSVSMALSMVYNGANGVTKDEIAKTINVQKIDITNLNKQNLSLIEDFNSTKDSTLKIANSIWAKQGAGINKQFSDTTEKYYKAPTNVRDFNNKATVGEINRWANDNTNGKIPSIIDTINPSQVMFLINATYFKGTWTEEFDKSSTQDMDFTPAKGNAYKTPLMSLNKKDLPYIENGDFQSVELTYGKDKQLAMYVFLPESMKKFIGSLDESNWNKWMSQYKESKGTLLLPKFKMDYTAELNDNLSKLGMPTSFTDKADFSGIGGGLKISDVLHKTYLDVNEEGTEAAAITSIGVETTSVQPNDSFYMQVNKPFFIAIRDTKSGSILFAGVINQPKAGNK